MRVADYIMQRLNEEGINHLFMVTGRGVLYLSDAAAKLEGINCVSVHHEQSAAYAAMAYAQQNEKLGACLVSTGCASTNAITGVLCAWQDDVPCVFISGQNSLKETVRYTGLPIRTFGQQEADIVKIIEPITKYAVMITDPLKIAYEMDKALYLAQNGRKGPVWIDVPLDIQNMRIEPDELARYTPDPEIISKPTEADISYVINELKKAKRPVILLGSGIRSAAAVKDLEELLNKYKIPVVYANSAVDIYGTKNEHSIGVVGTMGANRAANFAVQNSDLILVLGCRLTSMVTGPDAKKFAREAKIIAVDIDKYEHTKGNVNVEKVILADVKEFIKELSKREFIPSNEKWLDKCNHWKTIFPKCEDNCKKSENVDLYYLAECLTKSLSDDAVFICDAGLEELILPTNISFGKDQRCLHPASQGAMGYALPAAIGAYCSCEKQIVTAVGDGSIMMNLQELQTISYNKYPIKILVINNNCYAVIRKRQQDLFRTRTVGTDESNGISCPDFKKVAECFGIHYEKIEISNELDTRLKDIIEMPKPVICEIMGLENQGYIHNSYRKNKKGCFVQPPIEDQSPFLDRDLFLSEMIIEPIDQ